MGEAVSRGRYYTREFVELGGIRQYVTARTYNPGSPPVLFLHGGPGAANIRFLDWYYHKGLAKNYTIVHWDQRGAGKSFSKDITAEAMNVERFVEDCAELAVYLRNKFGQEKLFLVGESWGAFLGTLVAHKYPEYFYSFVAVSPGVAPAEGLKTAYDFLFEEAQKSGDPRAIKAIEEAGKPPYNLNDPEEAKRFWVLRNQVVKLGGFSRRTPKWYILALSLPEFLKYQKTMSFTSKTLSRELYGMDLYGCRKFEIPYHIFEGKYDLVTPPSVSQKYFEGLDAPEKSYTLFENSAHTLGIDEAERYVECLDGIFKRCLNKT